MIFQYSALPVDTPVANSQPEGYQHKGGHIVQSRILVMSDYIPFAKVQRIIKNEKEN